jgi:hypothetical protein
LFLTITSSAVTAKMHDGIIFALYCIYSLNIVPGSFIVDAIHDAEEIFDSKADEIGRNLENS